MIYEYDGEDVFPCKGCGEQIYIKQPGRIPIVWLTGKAHDCSKPEKFAKARQGPGQGRQIILKKR